MVISIPLIAYALTVFIVLGIIFIGIRRCFPLFGIEADGFWTAASNVQSRLYVLVSYAAREEPGEVGRRYMQSAEFSDDTRNFDVADIVGVCVEYVRLLVWRACRRMFPKSSAEP
jgi:hypothetical protein